MKHVSPEDLTKLVGSEVGVSDWVEITQEMVNQFADVTYDHQFIHIDPVKAAETPFGGPIAHGFLTMSLLSKFAGEAGLVLDGAAMGVNYGFDKLRFIAPVPVGFKVRGRLALKSFEEKKPGQFLLTYDVTVDIMGGDKPALVAEWLGMQMVK